MPVFLRYGRYKVYFWANESGEPIHFHIASGDPSKDDTKVWVLRDGGLMVAHNKGRVPKKDLLRVIVAMRGYLDDYESLWRVYEGDVRHIDD